LNVPKVQLIISRRTPREEENPHKLHVLSNQEQAFSQTLAKNDPQTSFNQKLKENGNENYPKVQILNVCSSTPEESTDETDLSAESADETDSSEESVHETDANAPENSFDCDTSTEHLFSRSKRSLTKTTCNLSHDLSDFEMLPQSEKLLETKRRISWESDDSVNSSLSESIKRNSSKVSRRDSISTELSKSDESDESVNSSSPESIKCNSSKVSRRESMISTELKNNDISEESGVKQAAEPKASCSIDNLSNNLDTDNWNSESNTGNEMSIETDEVKITCNEMISEQEELQKGDNDDKQAAEPKALCSIDNLSNNLDTGNWNSKSNTGNVMSIETDEVKVTCNEMISEQEELQKVDNDDTSSTSKPGIRSPDELIAEYLRNPDPEGFEHFLRRLKRARRQCNMLR